MYNNSKKDNSRRTKKKVTAKSFHKNVKIDFFSKKVDLSSENESLGPSEAKSSHARGRLILIYYLSDKKVDFESIVKDWGKYQRIKEKSEKFYDEFLNYEKEPDLSRVLVFEEESLVELAKKAQGNPFSVSPIITHPQVPSYVMVVVSPKSKCGPYINTRGAMVIIFIEVEEDKVFFESYNSIERKRKSCRNQVQVLVIPDDLFVVHNDSSDTTARLIAISCKDRWKDYGHLKDRKSVHL